MKSILEILKRGKDNEMPIETPPIASADTDEKSRSGQVEIKPHETVIAGIHRIYDRAERKRLYKKTDGSHRG